MVEGEAGSKYRPRRWQRVRSEGGCNRRKPLFPPVPRKGEARLIKMEMFNR